MFSPPPGPGGKWQICTAPNRCHRETADGCAIAVPTKCGSLTFRLDLAFQRVSPASLLKRRIRNKCLVRGWEISPDGKRFLMAKGEERKPASSAESLGEYARRSPPAPRINRIRPNPEASQLSEPETQGLLGHRKMLFRSCLGALLSSRHPQILLRSRKPQPVTEMILVQNWTEELKRLVPAK